VSLASETPQSKRRGWARFLAFLTIGTLSLFLGGFIAFAQNVDRMRAPKTMPVADGIVVWTGKGGGRTAGRIQITPYPVERADNRKWYMSAGRAKRLGQEYMKLLLSYTRGREAKITSPNLPDVPQN